MAFSKHQFTIKRVRLETPLRMLLGIRARGYLLHGQGFIDPCSFLIKTDNLGLALHVGRQISRFPQYFQALVPFALNTAFK